MNKDSWLWFEYCKAINKPYLDKRLASEYYLKGFKEWKKLRNEYQYFKYMVYHC